MERGIVMHTLLKKYFGYERFRPLQEEIIHHVMAQQDACVIMPTGSGKSLCYQLPALMLDGVTLVVSPLIALMKDQVDGLCANGISAACINSTLTVTQIQTVLEQARRGQLKLLYLAPERLANPAFRALLQRLPIRLITIDEAHCISEWGHDFRPEYRNLSSLRPLFPTTPWIALTATANERVRNDITEQLQLNNGRIFLSSFNRPNLTYLVRPKHDWLKTAVQALNRVRGSSAIIYCLSRKETENIALKLKQQGYHALPYHAGLDDRTRRETQEKFIRDECPIIVATIAFGMGIDKSNVRLVIHASLPRSIEGYYQETGRAGRDGLQSTCLFFFSAGDRWKREYFIKQLSDPEEQARARKQMEDMMHYAQTTHCRRKYLLEYFGETWPDTSCQGCDVCLGLEAETAETPSSITEEDYDITLFEELRALRKRLADDRGIAAYLVFGDRSLREMARTYPQSPSSFRQIYGVGSEKAKAFGTLFLSTITNYAKKHGNKTDITVPEIKEDPRKNTSDTLAQTKTYLEEGYALHEMASLRGLTESTILTHLEKLSPKLTQDTVSHLFTDKERLTQIKAAFETSRSWILTPVKKQLGQDFSFEEIRLARLVLRHQQERKN
jgi:RecQ family ATP-dependent DNA helicase